MEEEIQSVTSSEWKLVHRRLDDLENLVTDLKQKLEILGECKCNQSNSRLETQHSDDEETQTTIGLNTQSKASAASRIIDISGQSTVQSEEIFTSVGRDASANNTADSISTPSIVSSLGDSTSANAAANGNNGMGVSTKSTLSNGIRIQEIEKYRRAQVKLKRCDQVQVTGTSSFEFRFSNNKSRLTSTNKEPHISFKRHPVLPRKRNGVRGLQVSAPPLSHKKPFVCHFCSKRLGLKSDLTRHIRVHTGDKPFQCNTCLKKFTLAANLKTHTRVHSVEKPFDCGFCPMKFSASSTLTSHTRVHTGDKPFECAFCSKKFGLSQTLVSHMRSHTGERPYSCQLCPKKFSERHNMVVHLRSHTGERPYPCQLCPKTFTTPSHLRVHLRVHTREKPYFCPFCPKEFAQRGHLKSHLKRHPEETRQPQVQIRHEEVSES